VLVRGVAIAAFDALPARRVPTRALSLNSNSSSSCDDDVDDVSVRAAVAVRCLRAEEELEPSSPVYKIIHTHTHTNTSYVSHSPGSLPCTPRNSSNEGY
jgi:hypothetical protein